MTYCAAHLPSPMGARNTSDMAIVHLPVRAAIAEVELLGSAGYRRLARAAFAIFHATRPLIASGWTRSAWLLSRTLCTTMSDAFRPTHFRFPCLDAAPRPS
jgi:hypothetical protein